MLYEVTIDGRPLDGFTEAKIVQERNKVPSLTFTALPDSALWDSVERVTEIKAYDTQLGRLEFDGRVLTKSPTMSAAGDLTMEVVCEGAMGYLNDSVQPYMGVRTWVGDESRTGLQEYVDWCLELHNSKTEERKHVFRGIVDAYTNSLHDVTKGAQRQTTWEALNEKLPGAFGGEMQVRRGDDGLLYFDYRDHLGEERATAIELGRNLAQSTRSVDPSALVTRMYPLGAKIEKTQAEEELPEEPDDESDDADAEELEGGTAQEEQQPEVEEDLDERVTIAEANGGCEYIEDKGAMAEHGIIEGYVEFDDYTTPLELLRRAKEWLADNNSLPVTYRLDAYDLSLLGLDPDRITLLDRYPVRIPLGGLGETAEVVKRTIDVCDPGRFSFEFGTGRETSTGHALAAVGAASSAASAADKAAAAAGSASAAAGQASQKADQAAQKADGAAAAAGQATEAAGQATEAAGQATEAAGQAAQKADQASQKADGASAAAGQAAQKADGAAEAAGQASQKADQAAQKADQASQKAEDAAAAADQAADAVAQVTETVSLTSSSVEANANAITSLIETTTTVRTDLQNGFEQVNERISTELSQTDEGWQMRFADVLEELSSVDGRTQTRFAELVKYIRFTDGDIVLGRTDSDMQLIITNDRMSFYQGGVEVAYMSDTNLYITDATIVTSMSLGVFEFVPRENGNLTFRKKG